MPTKIAESGLQKVNFPESNPTLDTWWQKKKKKEKKTTPNPQMQPHLQNYPICFLWRVCKQTSITFVLEPLQAKRVLNTLRTKVDSKKLFLLPIQEKKKEKKTSKVKPDWVPFTLPYIAASF